MLALGCGRAPNLDTTATRYYSKHNRRLLDLASIQRSRRSYLKMHGRVHSYTLYYTQPMLLQIGLQEELMKTPWNPVPSL